jgi:hypothetical protein
VPEPHVIEFPDFSREEMREKRDALSNLLRK